MQSMNPDISAEDVSDEPVLVLMASALIGPTAWARVEHELSSRGWDVMTAPSADEADPATATEAALAYATAIPADRPVILIPHSNAGNFVPTLIEIRNVERVVFVDATIPMASGTQPLAPAEFLTALEPLADDDGILPPWTEWFDEPDVAALFPDAATRSHIEAAQAQLPLDFLRGELRIEAGWDRTPSSYLAFGGTYADDVARARALSWPVIELDGRHLHMVVDPAGVADAILTLIDPAG
jgi:hypothetical protein